MSFYAFFQDFEVIKFRALIISIAIRHICTRGAPFSAGSSHTLSGHKL